MAKRIVKTLDARNPLTSAVGGKKGTHIQGIKTKRQRGQKSGAESKKVADWDKNS